MDQDDITPSRYSRKDKVYLIAIRIYVTWHHKMSGKSYLLVPRYRHIYIAKNKGNKEILTDIIKFISILENGNSGMFGIILKLDFQGRGLYQN